MNSKTISKEKTDLNEKFLSINSSFLKFLIAVFELIEQAPLQKVFRSDVESFKQMFPTFENIINLFEDLPSEIREYFALKLEFFHDSEQKPLSYLDKEKKLRNIKISFGSKQNNSDFHFIDFPQEYFFRLSTDLKHNFQTLLPLSLDKLLLQVNLFQLSALEMVKEKKSFSFSLYQLVLQFLHFSDWFSHPIPILPVIFFGVKKSEFVGNKRNKDLFGEILLFFAEKTQEQIMKNLKEINSSVSLLLTKNDSERYSFTNIYNSKTNLSLNYINNYVNSFSTILLLNNHIMIKLHKIGLRFFMVELPPIDSLKNFSELDYVFEIMRFKERTIIIGVTSTANRVFIRRNIKKIESLSFSRSLASHFLINNIKDPIITTVGLFPALTREFNFKNAPNILKRYLLEDNSNYDYIINTWNKNKFINTFSQCNEFFPDDITKNIKDPIELESLMQKKTINSLLTSVPFHVTHIEDFFIYIGYIHFKKSDEKLDDVIREIKEYIQFWGERTSITITTTQIFFQVVFEQREEIFIETIKEIIKRHKILHEYLTFDIHMFDKKTYINNDIRYRNQNDIPSFEHLDPETGEWDLPSPTLSKIKTDFEL